MAFCAFCHSSLSCKSNGGTEHLKHHSDKCRAKDPRQSELSQHGSKGEMTPFLYNHKEKQIGFDTIHGGC